MSETTARPADKERRILNCLPSPAQERDWSFGAAVRAGVSDVAVPPSTDLRADWWKIGDQRATGSCVGWATADSLLRYHFVKAGWIAKTDVVSPRFTWMASKELDEFIAAPTTFIEPEGTSLKAALDVSRKYGAVLDPDLPFDGGGLFPDEADVFYTKAARLKIASYTNLGASLTAWRRWLANNGPILVRLDVDATWDNATAEPRLRVYQAGTARGGHAVALVGYTPEHFIVRNSWGTGWADKGFAYASNAYAGVAFTEAYGVTLGGASQVAAGIAQLKPAAAKAARAAVADGSAFDDILQVVLDTAKRVRGIEAGPLTSVSRLFEDVGSFIQYLGVLQDRLGLRQRLTSARTAVLAQLRQGFFDELADWVVQQMTGGEA